MDGPPSAAIASQMLRTFVFSPIFLPMFSPRHCEGRSDQAIHSFFLRRDGLLRGAWHRARIRATRWLAMTLRAQGVSVTVTGVSRTRCSVLDAAPQSRDPRTARDSVGPGSAAHR